MTTLAVTYERNVRVADFESKKLSISLTQVLEDGPLDETVVVSLRDTIIARVHEGLGIAKPVTAPVKAPAQEPAKEPAAEAAPPRRGRPSNKPAEPAKEPAKEPIPQSGDLVKAIARAYGVDGAATKALVLQYSANKDRPSHNHIPEGERAAFLADLARIGKDD